MVGLNHLWCGEEDSILAKWPFLAACRTKTMTDSLDDKIIDTPHGQMTWGEWKKNNPVQLPSRRTKGKKLPNKIKRLTDEP
jgi:hypothetical protein